MFGLLLTLLPETVLSSTVMAGNNIVQASACVGFDCANGETFSTGPLKLKENNTRIRLVDTSAARDTDFDWFLQANDSAKGGADGFRLQWMAMKSHAVLSDGTAPDYDCTQLPDSSNPAAPYPVIGTIPEGEPIESPYCDPITAYESHPALNLTPAGTVSIGYDSSDTAGEVSVGSNNALRQIKHLAEAVADTDALIKRQMESFDPLKPQKQTMQMLEKRTAKLEDRVNALNRVLNNRARFHHSPLLGGLGGVTLSLLGLMGILRRRR